MTATFDLLPPDTELEPTDQNVPTGTTLWYQVAGVRADGSVSLPVLVGLAVPPVS